MTSVKRLIEQGATVDHFINLFTPSTKKERKAVAVLTLLLNGVQFEYRYKYKISDVSEGLKAKEVIELDPELVCALINVAKAEEMGIQTADTIYAAYGKNLIYIGGRTYYAPFQIRKSDDELTNMRVKYIKNLMKHLEENGKYLMTLEHRILKAMGLKLIARDIITQFK